ncbi:hypothetical protein VKT23_006402 [Stygiomarasmius scandens]|uniref:Uncharacterized protein n=1 Tax=Marasmiellus scandens TaxID=2682957 RepID=A0ABR1JQ73_9AGAR
MKTHTKKTLKPYEDNRYNGSVPLPEAAFRGGGVVSGYCGYLLELAYETRSQDMGKQAMVDQIE